MQSLKLSALNDTTAGSATQAAVSVQYGQYHRYRPGARGQCSAAKPRISAAAMSDMGFSLSQGMIAVLLLWHCDAVALAVLPLDKLYQRPISTVLYEDEMLENCQIFGRPSRALRLELNKLC